MGYFRCCKLCKDHTVFITCPSVAAEDGGTEIFGTAVSDIQENVAISGGKITGTLKYLDSGDIASYWGAGNFLALKFSASDWSEYESVRVGLEPSAGTGLVDILSDDDKNGVFKITNKDTQVFKIVATNGTNETVLTLDLSELTLEDE